MAELTGAILNETPTPLSARIPTGFQAVVARCLAKEPSVRYHTASEVRAALEALEALNPGAGRPRAEAPSRRLWMAGAGVLAVALALTLALRTEDIRRWIAGGAAGVAASGPARIGSLAVLPLVNLSGDPAQEYFADGMTEELITDLASIRSLRVISRTSSMVFKQSKKSLGEIAAQLHVDAIVEGSVLRAGDRVRITAQLIQASEDRHLWANSYEREVSDVLSLQGEVARDIAEEIRLQVSPQEMTRMIRHRPVNPEAYELYLRGRYDWSKASEESVRKGIEYYKKALALDPGDARYSSGLADAYLLQTQVLGVLAPREGMARAKEYARRALAEDDSSAEAHTSMAVALFFGDWNWTDAERHVRLAIQLNPGYSTAHLVYSAILTAGGRVDEALEQDRLARELDPLSLFVNWNSSNTLFHARRYDEAIARAKHAAELDPTSLLPQGSLSRIAEEQGHYEESLDILEKGVPPRAGGKAAVAMLREAYRAGGAAGYWRKMLELETGGNPAKGKNQMRLAVIYARLEDRENALASLERALVQHSGDMVFVNVEPSFDPLRGEPRFQAVVRRVGALPI
jgi:TolB-like protein